MVPVNLITESTGRTRTDRGPNYEFSGPWDFRTCSGGPLAILQLWWWDRHRTPSTTRDTRSRSRGAAVWDCNMLVVLLQHRQAYYELPHCNPFPGSEPAMKRVIVRKLRGHYKVLCARGCMQGGTCAPLYFCTPCSCTDRNAQQCEFLSAQERAAALLQQCLSKAPLWASERLRGRTAAAGPPTSITTCNPVGEVTTGLAVLERGAGVAARPKTAKLVIRPRICVDI